MNAGSNCNSRFNAIISDYFTKGLQDWEARQTGFAIDTTKTKRNGKKKENIPHIFEYHKVESN